jgi:hypothetical protein
MQDYTNTYQIIYERFIKEAKRRVNNKYILRAKHKMKALWHIIDKEVGTFLKYYKKIDCHCSVSY